jgi:diacylglycerol kinase
MSRFAALDYLQSRVNSFRYAFRGIAVLLETQPNARLHALATMVALLLGFLLRIDRAEWLWILLMIFVVWIAESINTSLEFLADSITTEIRPSLRDSKDVAATSVLLAASLAFLVGSIILVPKLWIVAQGIFQAAER